MLLLSWLIIVRIIVISRMHRARRAWKEKRECVRESANIWEREKWRDNEWCDYIGEKSVHDEACKVSRNVIRALDLGASRYIAVSEEDNLAALINLSLMHCEGYLARRTSPYTEGVCHISRIPLHLQNS